MNKRQQLIQAIEQELLEKSPDEKMEYLNEFEYIFSVHPYEDQGLKLIIGVVAGEEGQSVSFQESIPEQYRDCLKIVDVDTVSIVGDVFEFTHYAPEMPEKAQERYQMLQHYLQYIARYQEAGSRHLETMSEYNAQFCDIDEHWEGQSCRVRQVMRDDAELQAVLQRYEKVNTEKELLMEKYYIMNEDNDKFRLEQREKVHNTIKQDPAVAQAQKVLDSLEKSMKEYEFLFQNPHSPFYIELNE